MATVTRNTGKAAQQQQAAQAAAAGQQATNANGQAVQAAPAQAAAPVQPARAGLTRTLAAALRGQGAVQAQQGNMWLRLNVAQWAAFGSAAASLPTAQQQMPAVAQAVHVAGLPQAQQQAAGKAVNVRVYNDQTAVVFVPPTVAYGLYCWYAQQANNSLRIGAAAMYKQFAKQAISSAHYGPQFGQQGFGSLHNTAA